MKKLAEVARVFITIGNHDLYFKNSSEIDSAIIFEGIPNVTIIRETCRFENLLLVPWIVEGNEEKLASDLKKFEDDCTIVLGHFDIMGFAINSSKVSEYGFDTSAFDNFDLVISGHYHTRSTKMVGETEIIYVGTPYQLNRGDMGEERGFMILDTETLEYTFVANKVSPKFTQLKFPQRFLKSEVVGNFVDIIVNCEDDVYNEKMFDKYLDEVVKNSPVTTPKVQIVSSKTDEDLDFDVELENMATTTKLLVDYVNVAFENLSNKDVLIKKIMDIHSQVTNRNS